MKEKMWRRRIEGEELKENKWRRISEGEEEKVKDKKWRTKSEGEEEKKRKYKEKRKRRKTKRKSFQSRILSEVILVLSLPLDTYALWHVGILTNLYLDLLELYISIFLYFLQKQKVKK